MTDPLDAELAFAHELADLADAISLPAFRGDVAVETKADGTPVTEVDREVERRLRAAIAERFPDHAVLGEEDGRRGPADAPTWIIDPVDGTRSFVTSNPMWATLIALADAAGERVAVISAPAMGRRWDGRRGGPARVDGREVRVSAVRDLADAQVSFGDLSSFGAIDRPEILTRLTAATLRQRGYGDFLSFCYVAEGFVDVAVEGVASRWDFAAPKCVVEAAGGTFTDLAGHHTAAGGSGVATNGWLHGEVLRLLA